MSAFLGSENNDGLLMYLLHRGYDQTTNQMYSAANDVWDELADHPAASLYGVAENNILSVPDIEILDQTTFSTFPTLLFVRVEDNEMTAILSRINGGTSYNKIRKEFIRLLKSESIEIQGQAGVEDWFEANGKGGLAIGLGGFFNCNKYLPKWLCGFPVILLVLLIVVAVLFTKKMIS